MSEEQCEAVRREAIALITGALQPAAGRQGLVSGRAEVQVHKAVDLLRFSAADATLLRAAEFLSCSLREMNLFLREGRVNAFESRALRVRRLFETL